MAVMVDYAGVPSRAHFVVAASILVASGAAAAAVFGALLGAMGAAFGSPVTDVLITAAGLVIVGSWLRSDRPWQLDHETSGSWLEYHDWRTVAFNGVALGVGMTSRIGYWAWYVLPLGALAFQDPIIGAAIFTTYACARLGLSTTVTARMRPGCLTPRQSLFVRALDPIAGMSICLVIGTVWLNST